MGVLVVRALVFGVSMRAPGVWAPGRIRVGSVLRVGLRHVTVMYVRFLEFGAHLASCGLDLDLWNPLEISGVF